MAKGARPVTQRESRFQVGKWLVAWFSATNNAFAEIFRFLVGGEGAFLKLYCLVSVLILALFAVPWVLSGMLWLWRYVADAFHY
jgi:hypothetical protein